MSTPPAASTSSPSGDDDYRISNHASVVGTFSSTVRAYALALCICRHHDLSVGLDAESDDDEQAPVLGDMRAGKVHKIRGRANQWRIPHDKIWRRGRGSFGSNFHVLLDAAEQSTHPRGTNLMSSMRSLLSVHRAICNKEGDSRRMVGDDGQTRVGEPLTLAKAREMMDMGFEAYAAMCEEGEEEEGEDEEGEDEEGEEEA